MSEKLKQIFQKDRIWTIPNFISLFRIFLSFVVFYFILQRQAKTAIILALVAIFSDTIDGMIARRLNQISELGKILDPLGDKLSVGLASIALHISYGLPLWIVVLIIGRDVLIVVGSTILMTRLRRVVASEKPGKIAVSSIALLLLSYLFGFKPLYGPLTILAVFMIGVSFVYYAIRFFQTFKEDSQKELRKD